jgi:hypothetical protein
MLVEIDVKLLVDKEISADQFLVADMLLDKKYDLLIKYLSQRSKEEKEFIFAELNRKEFVFGNWEETCDLKKIIVRSSFINLFSRGDFFDELVKTYPASVTRPDGTKDYLRVDLSRARKLYGQITGNKRSKHDQILKCLQFEVKLRTNEGKLGWMKRLPKWLSSEEWKSYEQRLNDESLSTNAKEERENYGTRLE